VWRLPLEIANVFVLQWLCPLLNGKINLEKRIVIKLFLEWVKTIKQYNSTSYIRKYENKFGEELRITKHRLKLQERVRFRNRVLSFSIFLRNKLKVRVRMEIEFDFAILSSVRARFLAQWLKFAAIVFKLLRGWTRNRALTADIANSKNIS